MNRVGALTALLLAGILAALIWIGVTLHSSPQVRVVHHHAPATGWRSSTPGWRE